MRKGKKVYAVIGAAGSGKRMGGSIPKQFLKIDGKTILETTVEKFALSEIIDGIVITAGKEYIESCRLLCRPFQKIKSIEVICGGRERQDSVFAAIDHLQRKGIGEDSILLIHDGVRPYVSQRIIEDVTEAALRSGAAIPVVSLKDTVRHREGGTLDRSSLCAVQTPQAFCFSLIREAHLQACRDGVYGTDDAGLVENAGHRVALVPGEYANIKITTPEDLKMEMKIGTGFDVHVLTENRKLILAGVEIPYPLGLEGHSDADVLTHALMDAMLGAAAMGDIGKLFPDNDSRFKDISSLKLLKEVMDRLSERGYALGNADITVICQRPKLSPYIETMRGNLAETLGAEKEKISIKATTTEKLGFTGRGEGIAAEAVCLLTR